MKKTNKRVISLLLAVLMVATSVVVGFTAFAEDPEFTPVDDKTHTASDGTVSDHSYTYDESTGIAVCDDCGYEYDHGTDGCIYVYENEEGTEFHIATCILCGESKEEAHTPGTEITRFVDKGIEDEYPDGYHCCECTLCGAEMKYAHNWKIGYQTDDSGTYHYIGCENCNIKSGIESHYDSELNYLAQDGTYTTDGLCDVCKLELSHRYKKSGGTSASCLSGATNEYTCVNCGDSYTETVSAALGHDWASGVGDEGLTFDWSSDFKSCTATFTCTRCHDSKYNMSYTVYAGSGYTDNIITVDTANSVDATCTTEGKTVYKATFTISDIGNASWHGFTDNGDGTFTFSTEYTVVTPALGHDYSIFVSSTQATCTKAASTTYKCSRCDKTSTTEDTNNPALGHTPAEAVKENVVESTCTKTGSYDSVVYCSVCNEKISSEKVVTPLADHTLTNVTITKQPTCTESGVKSGFCTSCGQTITSETIPATGHDYSVIANVVDPTCDTDGYTIYKCANCTSTKIGNTISATDHNWVAQETKDPTCDSSGYTLYKCTKCDSVKMDDITAPLGHDYVEGFHDSDGHGYYCTVCGATVTSDHYDADFDFVCDCSYCQESISFFDHWAHYIVGWPSYHSGRIITTLMTLLADAVNALMKGAI